MLDDAVWNVLADSKVVIFDKARKRVYTWSREDNGFLEIDLDLGIKAWICISNTERPSTEMAARQAISNHMDNKYYELKK